MKKKKGEITTSQMGVFLAKQEVSPWRVKERGITLIALVITVIVLLILAGIAISMLTGNNSILKQATRARDKCEESAKQEKSTLDQIIAYMNEVLQIEEALGEGDLSSGDGTENRPYLIQSIEDLVTLSNNVKDGDTYEGKTFKLLVNLDFKNDKSYLDATRTDFGDINGNGTVEGLKTELTTGKGFEPIGQYNGWTEPKHFKGSFEGNNKGLINLYINRNENNVGLFGFSEGITIKNFTLKDLNITGKDYVGLIGHSYGNGKIINCKISGNINGNSSVGSFVGMVSNYSPDNSTIEIENSNNLAKVVGKEYIGGFIGASYGSTKITNSSNMEKIVSDNNSSYGYRWFSRLLLAKV